MSRLVHSKIFLITLSAFLTAAFAAAAVWYWQAGDTSAALAALVQATPTASPASSVSDPPVARGASKLAGQAELAGALGVIQAVDEKTVTVQTAQGISKTFTLRPKSKIIVVNLPNASTNDLRVGDKALVWGVKIKTAAREILVPRVILAAPSNYDRNNVLVGRIIATGDNTLTLQTLAGERTVTTNSQTQIFGKRLVSASFADLKPRAGVLVVGAPQADNSFAAQVITSPSHLRARAAVNAERRADKQAAKQARQEEKRAQKAARQAAKNKNPNNDNVPGAFGSVKAISPTEIQVATLKGKDKTIALNGDTKIIVVNSPTATTANIQVGDQVLVIGARKQTAARVVLAAPASYTLDNVAVGKIKTVQVTRVDLKTKRGDLNVFISNDTLIFDGTVHAVTAADLVRKDRALAIGIRDGKGGMNAQVLFAIGKKQK